MPVFDTVRWNSPESVDLGILEGFDVLLGTVAAGIGTQKTIAGE